MFLICFFFSPVSNLPLPSYIMSPDDESSQPNLQLVYLLNSLLQIKAQIFCSYHFLQSFKNHFTFPNSCLLSVLLQCFALIDLREHTVILNLFLYLFFLCCLVSYWMTTHPALSFLIQKSVSDALLLLLLLSFSWDIEVFFFFYWGVLNKSSYLQYFPPINLSFYCWSNENVLLQDVILWVILHVVLLDPLGKKSNFLMLKYLYRYYLFIIYHTCYTIILWAQQPCICISLL